MILSPFLAVDMIKQDAWTHAKDVCERWDVPADAPEDLRDRRGRGLFTRDGYRVTAMTLSYDFGWGYRSPAASLVAALLPWAVVLWFGFIKIPVIGTALAAFLMLAAVTAGFATQLWDKPAARGKRWRRFVLIATISVGIAWLGKALFGHFVGGAMMTASAASPSVSGPLKAWPIIIALAFAVWPWWKARTEEHERLLLLQHITKHDTAAAAYPHIAEAAAARQAQAERAQKDDTPFFQLGTAIGVCSELLDLYSPDKGLAVGLTQHDASTHFLTVGKTGTGKTAGIIRPFVQQWLQHECGGLLLLDGKGDLPAEFAGTKDYVLIEPGKVRLNLIEGLHTEDLVDVLTSYASASGEDHHGGDRFWIASGETLLRSASILLEHCAESERQAFPWTVETIHRLINQKNQRLELIASYKEIIDSHPLRPYLTLAVDYFMHEFSNMPENTAGSVVGTVNSWLAPLMGHRDIFGWCCAKTSEVNPADCLKGGRYGVNCPQYRYGSAGSMVSALIKARIYRAILQRGSGWRNVPGQTQVLVVADEAQELLTKADSQMFPVGRSLGLVGLIGTQSIDELVARLGHDRTLALLNNFRSFAAFQSSKATMQWVSEQLGDVFRADFSDSKGIDIFRTGAGHNQMRQYNIPRHLVGAVDLFTGVTAERIQYEDQQKAGKIGAHREEALHYKIEHKPLLSAAEMSHFLNTPFRAIVQINRAGVVRRDVVDCQPIFG